MNRSPSIILAAASACALVFSSVLYGCAGSSTPAGETPWNSGPSGVRAHSSTELEAYFPLVDGSIFHYQTEALGAEPGSSRGALMMKAHRASATNGSLKKPGRTEVFEYRADGIATKTRLGRDAFLLRAPIAHGTIWTGPLGGQAQYQDLEVSVTTPSGQHQGCLTTKETRGGDGPVTVLTTFCRGVGIVKLEVHAGGAIELAELVYSGPPVDLGADGSSRLP